MLKRRTASAGFFPQIWDNRLDVATNVVTVNICSHIEFLSKQINEVKELISNHIKGHKELNDKSKLLDSIPGIGKKTIGVILAFLNVENFNSAKQVAAFVGLMSKNYRTWSDA